jgi:hypothetical protein
LLRVCSCIWKANQNDVHMCPVIASQGQDAQISIQIKDLVKFGRGFFYCVIFVNF